MRKNVVLRWWYMVVAGMLGMLVQKSEQQNVEFIMYTAAASWNDALSVCHDIGGELAKLDSRETVDALVKLDEETPLIDELASDFWIGLFDMSPTQRMWSTDCSMMTYSSNYDQNYKESDRCFKVDVSQDDKRGKQTKCSQQNPFMCQRFTDQCKFDEVMFSWHQAVSVFEDCTGLCSADNSCDGVLYVDTNDCYFLDTTGGLTHATANATHGIKFCNSLRVNTSAVDPSAVQSDVPDLNCTVTGPTPTPLVLPSSSAASVLAPSSSVLPSTSYIVPTCSPIVLTNVLTTHVTDYVTPTYIAVTTVTEMATPTYIAVSTVTVVATPTYIPISTVTVVATPTYIPVSTVTVLATPSCALISSSVVVSENMTTQEANLIAEEISNNLTVDPRQTSSYTRSLISVQDFRPSATAMGIVGISCVLIPIVLMICLDFRQMFNDLRGKSRSNNTSKNKK